MVIMITKIAAISSAAGLLAFAGVALAQSDTGTSVNVAVRADAQAKLAASRAMVLQVNPQGRVLIRGTVVATSTNSVTLKSWSGNWTVNVSSGTEVLSKGATLADFQSGDFVGAEGAVSSTTDFTLDARVVRAWYVREVVKRERQEAKQEVRENRQTVQDVIKMLTPRNYQGTVSSLDGRTFTLTTESGIAYAVTLTANAQVLQSNWRTLDFAQVQNGDTVRVWGPATSATASTSATITASVFRDLSIPR